MAWLQAKGLQAECSHESNEKINNFASVHSMPWTLAPSRTKGLDT